MKNFIIVIIFAFALTACNGTLPIVDTACDITTEICKYATLICNNITTKDLTTLEIEEYKEELQEINKSLKSAYSKSEVNKLSKTNEAPAPVTDDLLAARNKLKKLVDKLEIK